MYPFGSGAPPPGSGYPQQSQPGYPPQSGYPPYQQSGYPSQPGYPPQPQPGYPPQTQPGYPPQPQSGYPPQPQLGYPPQQQPGYPQQPAYGYPPNPAQGFQQPPQQQYPPGGYAPYPGQQAQGAAYGAPQQGQYAQYPAQGISSVQYQQVGSSPAKPKGTPTVLANQHDPATDAAALRKAMKGFGTDEDGIINVLCRRTNVQRQAIAKCFKTSFGKDLVSDIKSETSGNFEKLLVALLTPTMVFYAQELHEAIVGVGTDEDVLIETLCTLTNQEVNEVKNAYVANFGRTLEDDLISDTSGNFKRLMVSLCNASRDESGFTDINQARNDANALLQAGKLKFGTDESTFNMILCQRNFQQLKLVFEQYQQLAGKSLEKTIKSEFSGDIEDGLLAIVRCVTNSTEYFAKCVNKSMSGAGTNDQQLIRLVATRCEIDMQDIKVAFEQMYGKSMKSFIKGDTSGHYKHALYALIGENRS